MAQLAVVGASVLYNLCRFWEYKMSYENGKPVGYERSLRQDFHYFVGYYTVLYLFIHFLIPFSIIALLNVRIAKTVTAANAIRLVLTLAHGHDSRRQRQITRMIAVVTGIFAACNVPPFCLNIWEAIYPASFRFQENCDEWHCVLAYVFYEISNVLVVANSSINFIVRITDFRIINSEFLH